ncbi:hypothetical protein EGW08_023135 [Elysia chlorotica]|uniref:Uncharacterized protein n=1 Tax=Elysia chlorotica TaxID=188477 RepID=A0A3S1AWG3_ELYCH|nr:hypothetical protein EGW08_023135 [Elysia chlorotica]
MDDTDSDEDTPRAEEATGPESRPPASRHSPLRKDCSDLAKNRENVAEKTRRISAHVKDAKERFRLAMKSEGERKMMSIGDEGKVVDHVTSKLPAQTQIKIFRGNLKSQREKGHITLTDIPPLDLIYDNEHPDSAREATTPTNVKDSVKLDLNPEHPGLSRRKTATKTILPETSDNNKSPPLTPRCTPRRNKNRDFSHIPTPRRSGDKLPTLTLSAKEDLIKEIAPGLLLRSKDSELTSSRSSVASSTSSLRSSVTSIISLTELKTLRVNCRVSEDAIVSTATNTNNTTTTNNNNSSSNNGVTSVITSNMSVTDMKRVLLGRSKVRGVEPANFCVIAVKTVKANITESPIPETEDEMVRVETEILPDDAHPFEERGRHLRRTR